METTTKEYARVAALAEFAEFTPFRIANEAGCSCPDAPDSAGGRMLASVADGIAELIDGLDIDVWHDVATGDTLGDLDDGGALHEIYDGAPSVYTGELWKQFVDLGAWSEDLDELGGTSGDMQKDAGMALYLIAQTAGARLLELAAETYRDNLPEDDDTEG